MKSRYRVRKGLFGVCVLQRSNAFGEWFDVKYAEAPIELITPKDQIHDSR